jgi:hypothetical protein
MYTSSMDSDVNQIRPLLWALKASLDGCSAESKYQPRTARARFGSGSNLWDDALQARPLSADRTGSPAAASGKREYLKDLPETFDDFGL